MGFFNCARNVKLQPARKYDALRRALELARSRVAWEALRLDSTVGGAGVTPPTRMSAKMEAHARYALDAPYLAPSASVAASTARAGGASALAETDAVAWWRDFTAMQLRVCDREGVRFLDDPDDGDDEDEAAKDPAAPRTGGAPPKHPLGPLKLAAGQNWQLDWTTPSYT